MGENPEPAAYVTTPFAAHYAALPVALSFAVQSS